MMRRHLAAAVLGLLGLAAVLAAPAGAHDGTSQHSMMWMDLDPNDSPNTGDKLYGIDFVAARATFDDKVRRWRIEMRPTVGGEPAFCDSGDYSADQVTAQKNPFTFRCNWDTTRLGDMTALEADHSLGSGPIAPNGEYTITVTAWNVGRPQGLLSSQIPEYVPHVLPTRTVIIQNPVSAPTGVSRSYDSTTGKVTVTWAGSSEPDIQKYIIQEKVGSGGWADVGERPHGATSFDRQITDVGTYQYRVSAVRPEVAQSGFTEAAALDVAAPPPPPSAASAEDPQALGPEPGVTDLSPPTTATTVQGGVVAPRPSGGGGSSLFNRPSAGSLPRPAAPKTTPTTADTGYAEALPYDTTPKTQNGVLQDDQELAGGEQPQSITKLITVPRPTDPRSLLVPLAGGLAIFVFAMQMTYVVRKRPAMAHMDDDFNDWMGL